MAMTNYPYETNFLKHMPGWPCNNSCFAFGKFDNIKNLSLINDEELFEAVLKSIKVYYDYDGKAMCFDIYDSSTSSDNGIKMRVIICSDILIFFVNNFFS